MVVQCAGQIRASTAGSVWYGIVSYSLFAVVNGVEHSKVCTRYFVQANECGLWKQRSGVQVDGDERTTNQHVLRLIGGVKTSCRELDVGIVTRIVVSGRNTPRHQSDLSRFA